MLDAIYSIYDLDLAALTGRPPVFFSHPIISKCKINTLGAEGISPRRKIDPGL